MQRLTGRPSHRWSTAINFSALKRAQPCVARLFHHNAAAAAAHSRAGAVGLQHCTAARHHRSVALRAAAAGAAGFGDSALPQQSAAPAGATNQQTLFNLINVIMGAGFVTIPYACKLGGWASIAVVWILGAIFAGTGLIVLDCCRRAAAAKTATAAGDAAGDAASPAAGYEDAAAAVFGPLGRRIVSALMYAELLGICVVYIVLEAEALSALLANSSLLATLRSVLPGGSAAVALASAIVVPTVLLPDLAALSNLGVMNVAAALTIGSVLLALFISGGGFAAAAATTAIVPATLPQVLGVVAFVYAGHSTFPVVQQSMQRPQDAPGVVKGAYLSVALVLTFVGTLGYMLYGPATADVVTANLPAGVIGTGCLLLTTVSPFAAFALTLEPVALALQRAIYGGSSSSDEQQQQQQVPYAQRAIVRLGMALCCAAAAAVLPFVGDLMSLVGCVLTTSISLILPAFMWLALSGDELGPAGCMGAGALLLLGAAIAVIGSTSALGSLQAKLAAAAATAAA